MAHLGKLRLVAFVRWHWRYCDSYFDDSDDDDDGHEDDNEDDNDSKADNDNARDGDDVAFQLQEKRTYVPSAS